MTAESGEMSLAAIATVSTVGVGPVHLQAFTTIVARGEQTPVIVAACPLDERRMVGWSPRPPPLLALALGCRPNRRPPPGPPPRGLHISFGLRVRGPLSVSSYGNIL